MGMSNALSYEEKVDLWSQWVALVDAGKEGLIIGCLELATQQRQLYDVITSFGYNNVSELREDIRDDSNSRR